VLGSIISLCVGSTYAKTLFPVLGAEGMTAYRVTIGALLLLALWRPWRTRLSASEWRAIALYGVTLGVMNLTFYLAISFIPIGIAIAIEFIGPLAVAMFSSRRKLDFLWIAFAVVGLLLLIPIRNDVSTLNPMGVAFALAAALCWALYIIFGKRAGTGHAGQVTSLGLAIAACVVLPFGIFRAGTALLDPSLIGFGLMVALLSSAIPYSLEMFALKRLPKQTFGILLSTEPAVGAITGWLILHELLTPFQLAAIASIIVASVGSTLTLPRDTTSDTADEITPT
jgi:inner membrane transporter RhtA